MQMSENINKHDPTYDTTVILDYWFNKITTGGSYTLTTDSMPSLLSKLV